MDSMSYLIIDGVSKSFGTFQALNEVSLNVARGQIHAILGENGAGKTTLMNILYGLYRPDKGQIFLDGEHLFLDSPADAIKHGIGMIHQNFMLVNSLTVAENIILGLGQGLKRIDFAAQHERIQTMSSEFGLEVDPGAPVWTLPMGIRQRVEILKALYRNASVLILDEPTSVLAPGEIDAFLEGLKKLQNAGRTILFITHKLEEVMKVANRVTVMRQGCVSDELEANKTSPRELARKMVGREVAIRIHHRSREPGARRLQLQDLVVLNDRGIKAVDGLTLDVCAGEIHGICGVDGNGQRELGETVAGLRPLISGAISIDGMEVGNQSVKERQRLGLGFVPEDRQGTALVLDYSIATNMALRAFDRSPASRHGILNLGQIAQDALRLMQRYDVRARSPQQPVRFLSGGNQQKVVLAREIDARPNILIVMQACKGLDVGAIEFVQNTLVDLKMAGVAILYVSTELEHVLEVADRVSVLYRGRIAATLPIAQADNEHLSELMSGISTEVAA
jgi:general nucleoside transport system ATP-binding protein